MIFVSISYGDMQSFRRCSLLRSRWDLGMFQSPTEICSHSDEQARRSSRSSTSRFNLLRRYAVIPTKGAQITIVCGISFNLLRRYAVIPTPMTIQDQTNPQKFQSPTEICSHSDDQPPTGGRLMPWFQSPTEICSHSDSRSKRRISWARCRFQSPTEICSHSDRIQLL